MKRLIFTFFSLSLQCYFLFKKYANFQLDKVLPSLDFDAVNNFEPFLFKKIFFMLFISQLGNHIFFHRTTAHYFNEKNCLHLAQDLQTLGCHEN
jgi:hypothetical protein